ncbi:MAG: cytochrome c [bacterium]|nr:cytochrome c [bacterium]
MKMRILTAAMLCLVLAVGCARNRPSDEPPIHLNTNMDEQPKYKAQASSEFFVDGQAMRQPVEGTVARGWLREDVVFYTGKTENGKLVKVSPVPVTMELLERGRERYSIYCSPCHGQTGAAQDIKAIVVQKGMLAPPSFHEQRLRDVEDGHLFDVITNGIRNMPPYKYQISVEDRWAIVAYFRALQRSQNATVEDVPESIRQGLK